MGLHSTDINPIPRLTSPLKGEEQNKLALMCAGGNGEFYGLMNELGLSILKQIITT